MASPADAFFYFLSSSGKNGLVFAANPPDPAFFLHKRAGMD